ncbi:MAG TPA: hypothetical protein VGL86_27205 [Polyangia bacterium]|jgi:hypothetical protein
MIFRLHLLIVFSLSSGCYLRPSAVHNAASPDGVSISLVGQDCEDHRAAKGDPVTRDLGVKLRVDNPTDKTLRISESAIRLQVESYSGGVRLPTVVEIPPHAQKTLTMDFTHHALCEPDRQFVVAWNDALALDDHPVAIGNLSFRP